MFTSCLCVWMELSFWTRAWTERELALVRNPARVCQSHSSALSPSLPVNVCWAGTKYVQQFTCVFLSLWASDVLTRSHTFLFPVAVFIVFLPLKKDSQCSEWKCFIRYAVLCVLCTSELFFLFLSLGFSKCGQRVHWQHFTCPESTSRKEFTSAHFIHS